MAPQDDALGAVPRLTGAQTAEPLRTFLGKTAYTPVRLAAINAQLIESGFPCEAKLVREGLPGKELKRIRRMLTEYGLSGWDMSYILQYDKELHDKMKKREK